MYVGYSWCCAVDAPQLFLDVPLSHFRVEMRWSSPLVPVHPHHARLPLLCLLCGGRLRPCSHRVPARCAVFFFLQNYCSDPKFIFVRRYTYQFERLNTSNWVAQQVVSFPVQSRSTLQNPEGPDDFFSACAIIFHIVLFGTLYSLCGFRTEYVGSFRTCLLFTPVSSSKTSRRYLMIIIAPGSSWNGIRICMYTECCGFC